MIKGLEPARQVIEKCGGIAATARLVGRDRTVVNRWLLPRAKGGTDGLIPVEHAHRLIEEAPAIGVTLQPHDFFRSMSGSEDAHTAILAPAAPAVHRTRAAGVR